LGNQFEKFNFITVKSLKPDLRGGWLETIDIGIDDIRQIKAGNNVRFARLLEKYKPIIDKVKKNYHASGHDEDDFAQVVRVSIWQAVLKFDEKRVLGDFSKTSNHLTRLVCKVAKAKIIDILRKDNSVKNTGVELSFDENHCEVVSGSFEGNLAFQIDMNAVFTGVHGEIYDLIQMGYSKNEIGKKLGYHRRAVHQQVKQMKIKLVKNN